MSKPRSWQEGDCKTSTAATMGISICFYRNRLIWWHIFMAGQTKFKPYQLPPGCTAYALHQLFKEELEWIQQKDIIPLYVNETAEWHNSFILVPKANGKARICIDKARLNQVLIWPVHRGPALNGIFLKLTSAKHLTFIDASSGYHNLRSDD